MTYNLSGVSGNTSGLLSLTQAVNEQLMLGWLGVLILIVATAICFIAFLSSTNDIGKAMASSMFISVGLALLLRAVDLIPNLALFICIIGAAAAVAIAKKSGS